MQRKRVAKYWLKFPELLQKLGRTPHQSQKLLIKMEIDKHPPKKGRRELFYVEKFNEYFPIIKNDLPTLFSGKISAVCHRGYNAMRDYYDLLWYLNNSIEPNYAELQELNIKVINRQQLIELLTEKTKNIEGKKIVEVISVFLDNPAEKKALINYPLLYKQAAKLYLAKDKLK